MRLLSSYPSGQNAGGTSGILCRAVESGCNPAVDPMFADQIKIHYEPSDWTESRGQADWCIKQHSCSTIVENSTRLFGINSLDPYSFWNGPPDGSWGD